MGGLYFIIIIVYFSSIENEFTSIEFLKLFKIIRPLSKILETTEVYNSIHSIQFNMNLIRK